MEIKRNGTQPSITGPAEWFTGTVRIDPLFNAKEPARTGGASVTFEPGARTAWHTHPLGSPPHTNMRKKGRKLINFLIKLSIYGYNLKNVGIGFCI